MSVKTNHRFSFQWNQHRYTIAYDTIGQGKPVLLLPAFSTVSSRSEMEGIARRIADRYQAFTLDWLGFGGPIDLRWITSLPCCIKCFRRLLKKHSQNPLL